MALPNPRSWVCCVSLVAGCSCNGKELSRPTPTTPRSAPASPSVSAAPAPTPSQAPPALSASASATASAVTAPTKPGPPRASSELRKNYPCPGCEFRLPPTDDSERRSPLVVLLHGDRGDVWRITKSWAPAADSHKVVLLSLRCPDNKGCKSSWWKWMQTAQYDDPWVGRQIDAVAADYPIDPKRVYAAGYSGGASFLGYYAPKHPERFAAVSHVAGGVKFVSECSTCKTPVHFLLGSQDPMLTLFTDTLHKWYESCGGHPLVWKILPGVTHEGIVDLVQASWGKELLKWLLQYQLECGVGAQ